MISPNAKVAQALASLAAAIVFAIVARLWAFRYGTSASGGRSIIANDRVGARLMSATWPNAPRSIRQGDTRETRPKADDDN
jgi:hypothetical protein